MKIVFLYSGSESMGIESLSARLKAAGHETALVFDPANFRGNRGRDNMFLAKLFDLSREDVVKAVIAHNPDVLACSCITGNYQWALDIAADVKRASSKPVVNVFGGVHPTLMPERVIAKPMVDALVVGEGDEAIVELARSIENGEITDTEVKNAWIKSGGQVYRNAVRPYIRDLDSMPYLDKKLFYDKVPFLRRGFLMLTARGCPYNCAYCSNSSYHDIYNSEKGHIRRYSPGRVIEELKYHMRGGPVNFLNIYDDIFTLDKKWLEEFVPLYKREINLPFICNIHPDHCKEEMVALIKEAGCHTVRLGVQTLHEPTLRKELKRGGSGQKVSQAIDLLNRRRIYTKVEHILGLPNEGREIQRAALKIYNKHRPTKIQTFWLIPFPGTKIMEKAVERGLISMEEADELEEGGARLKYTIFHPNAIGKNSVKELKYFTLLFDLLPFLPRAAVKWIIEKEFYRKLPYSFIAHQSLIMLNAILHWDREDLHSLGYVFARKNTP